MDTVSSLSILDYAQWYSMDYGGKHQDVQLVDISKINYRKNERKFLMTG